MLIFTCINVWQVLSFTCICCFFFSRHAMHTRSAVVLRCLLNCSSALYQCCLGCNLQHCGLWNNFPVAAGTRQKKSHSFYSCSSSISSPLVLHISLLHRCGITYRSACFISYVHKEELSIECSGKGYSCWFLVFNLLINLCGWFYCKYIAFNLLPLLQDVSMFFCI